MENELKEKLLINNENIWLKYGDTEKQNIEIFMREYLAFLKYGLTERRVTQIVEKELRDNGYLKLNELAKIEKGTKVYYVNREKSVYAIEVGNNIYEGLNIVGSHADSPRLDLKQKPIFEDTDMAFLKTQYYGGIKKHQWTTIPLMIVGNIYTTDGKNHEITIGLNENDPIFTITELLPHLAKLQMRENADKFINPENLNVLLGGIPFGKEAGSIKLAILKMANEKLGITESDLGSAELHLVPAFTPRESGIDKSFIASYGQDDRVCVYTSLKAFLGTKINDKRSKMLLISDKEEIGSVGNTGMESKTFEYFLQEVLNKMGVNYIGGIDKVLNNSKMLSADVTAGIDPMYKEVHEIYNDAKINGGVCITKYTGGRGKSGASDANPKFIAEIRKLFEDNNVKYQYSTMGKQEIGGGGTIAYILANRGVEVLDLGVPLLSMHSPYEVSSKADIYETYRAYKVFYNDCK